MQHSVNNWNENEFDCFFHISTERRFEVREILSLSLNATGVLTNIIINIGPNRSHAAPLLGTVGASRTSGTFVLTYMLYFIPTDVRQ